MRLVRPHPEEHPCKSLDLHGCVSKDGAAAGAAASCFETHRSAAQLVETACRVSRCDAPQHEADRDAMTHRLNLAGQMPLLTLIVLCAVTALLTDRFLSPLNLTNILVQSSIMAVIAMGMTFVIIGGGFDLSVGSTAALSGCIASMVMLRSRHRRGRRRRHPRRRRCRARQRRHHRLSQGQSLHHHARHHGAVSRRGLSDHRRRAGGRARPACPRASSPSAPTASLAFTPWSGCRPGCCVVLSLVMHAHPLRAAASTRPAAAARRPICRACRCAV